MLSTLICKLRHRHALKLKKYCADYKLIFNIDISLFKLTHFFKFFFLHAQPRKPSLLKINIFRVNTENIINSLLFDSAYRKKLIEFVGHQKYFLLLKDKVKIFLPVNKEKPIVILYPKEYFILVDLDGKYDVWDIANIIRELILAELINRGYLVLHANALLSPNDDGVLLVGESGSGKTILSIGLCKKYGYKLISNEITLYKNGCLYYAPLQLDYYKKKYNTTFFICSLL